MKKYPLLILCMLACLASYAQCNYIDAIYAVQPKLTVTYETEQRLNPVDGTKYATAIPVQMDIYRPVNLAGEGIVKRPVVILVHGNGRRRDSPEWIDMANSLAKRGYVVASLDYRADFFTSGEQLLIALACNTAPCKLASLNRTLYSNSMDVHKAIDFLVANQLTYQIDPGRFIVGGHSLGGATSFFASTVSKSEVSAYFPASFMTDAWYTNLDIHRPKIKGAILLSPATTDLNYVDASDNVPFFIYHGTHDPAAPFYSGRQLCGDASNPILYGGAAMAERVDAFPNYAYYFVEARGVGHVTGVTCVNAELPNATDALGMLWYPDLLRFLKTTMLDGYPNQVFKKVTPNNSSIYDYCAGATNGYCNGNANDFLLQLIGSGGACYAFPANWPNNTLGTLPWSGPAYQSCSYPATFPTAEAACGPNGWYLKQGEPDLFTQGVFANAHVIQDNAELKPIVVENDAFSISPNPASGIVTINCADAHDVALEIDLLNLQGTQVRKATLPKGCTSQELDLHDLSAGIYFLRMQHADGHSITQKLIKQ
jgi:acetyl esterase/lipase